MSSSNNGRFTSKKPICKSPKQNYNDNIDIGDLSRYSRLIDPPPAHIRPTASMPVIVHQNSKGDDDGQHRHRSFGDYNHTRTQLRGAARRCWPRGL